MSKHRVVVLKIVSKQLSTAEAAELYGMSRRQIQRLLARYRDGGIEAVDPRSRAPRSSPQATPPEIADRIVQLRRELTGGAWMPGQSRSPGTSSGRA